MQRLRRGNLSEMNMYKLQNVLLSISILIMVGCSHNGGYSPTSMPSDQDSTSSPQTQSSVDSPTQRSLIIFAAASLTDAFQELGKNFENANPGIKIQYNFTGSQIARMQIEQGAKADVFASADHKNMDLLVAEGLVMGNAYRDFATNRLVVIMPRGNPAGIEQLHDLARPGLKLILADPSVPAGSYARQTISKLSESPDYGPKFMTQVLANVVSNETDVRQVVTKIELGEADAGIVYVSDVVANSNLVEVAIPDEFNVTANYPMALLANTHNRQLAEAFVSYVLSSEGQTVLKKWGFGGPAQ
jgi:molybdate transport system substrate-binding protein